MPSPNLRTCVRVAHVADLPQSTATGITVLDVRTPDEFSCGHIPGAVNMPIDTLRDHLDDLDRNNPIIAYCQVGQRGYLATCILTQAGHNAANLSGGYMTYCQVRNTTA